MDDRSGSPEDVGRVRVLRDEPERLLLAAAADHDRDARPRDRLRRVQQPRRVELAALEARLAAALALEHLVCDPERLLEHLEALAQRREGEARGRPTPRWFQAAPSPSQARPPERTSRVVAALTQSRGLAVVDAADHQPEPGPLRVRRDEAEGGPALEHRLVDGPTPRIWKSGP